MRKVVMAVQAGEVRMDKLVGGDEMVEMRLNIIEEKMVKTEREVESKSRFPDVLSATDTI